MAGEAIGERHFGSRLTLDIGLYGSGVKAVMYCVAHAATEELVPAAGLLSGLTMCQAHGGYVADWSSVGDGLPREARCIECGDGSRSAYFVVEGKPLCIRHAADTVFPEDDMSAHDMAHAAYLALNASGDIDAY